MSLSGRVAVCGGSGGVAASATDMSHTQNFNAASQPGGPVKYRLISMLPLQILRLLGLVRAVEPIQLQGARAKEWALIIRGRGFTRLLRDEDVMPSQLGGIGWMLPRPMRFPAHSTALRYAQGMGLVPAQTHWPINVADRSNSWKDNNHDDAR